MRISDWSSDVCSSDLTRVAPHPHARRSFASSSPRHTVNLVNSAPVMPESPLLPVAEAQARLFAMAAPVAVEHAPLRHAAGRWAAEPVHARRSEAHTSELQSLMRISHAALFLKQQIAASTCTSRWCTVSHPSTT